MDSFRAVFSLLFYKTWDFYIYDRQQVHRCGRWICCLAQKIPLDKIQRGITIQLYSANFQATFAQNTVKVIIQGIPNAHIQKSTEPNITNYNSIYINHWKVTKNTIPHKVEKAMNSISKNITNTVFLTV